MKLTVLVDNHTYINQYYFGEPAVCYLIEDEERMILFDTGYSDAFINNAAKMGIDLSHVTDIVLSHGHNDHTGGLPAFFERYSQDVIVYAHSKTFLPKRHDERNIGSPLSLAEIKERAEVKLTTRPSNVSEHVRYLGEIPRIYHFEEGRAVGETSPECNCCWEADELADDSSLALLLPDGVFIVTGCAHGGICNTVLRATQITDEQRVCGVLGGFHLFETGNVLDITIETLLSLGVHRVYPAHCTSLAVKSVFVHSFETIEVGVGLTLEW
jgi:7,8-dihydropterin-6-yl-methyl-4-(beta-D-ribofuranosyl)aminobenzene 5'-phosphate synthase